VTERDIAFDYEAEQRVFERTFKTLAAIDGKYIFCRIGDSGKPTMRPTPNFFEAFSLGVVPHLAKINISASVGIGRIRKLFRAIRREPEFIVHTGAGSNQPSKLAARIEFVTKRLATIL